MSKIDITSFEWCDLIFEGKNKKYGAYVLRQESSKRHIRALIIVLVLSVILFSLPTLIKIITPKQDKLSVTEVTALSDLKEAEEDKKAEEPIEAVPPPPPLKSSIKFTPPVITKNEVREEEEIKTQEEVTHSDVAISTANRKGTDEVNGKDIADLNQMAQESQEEEKPFVVVEQMPQFPGGQDAMNAFIAKNLHYPIIAQENGIEGRVIIRFVINKQGKVGRVELVRGINPDCDKEAMRVIKSMPDWIPGKQNGVTVPVSYTIPVRFKLMNN